MITISSSLPPGDYKKLDNYIYQDKGPGVCLGQGSYGTVYKAYDSSDNYKLVAVKVIPINLILKDEEELKCFMRELDILEQVKDNHFVKLFRTKETKNHVYIFMEYCNGGDLSSILKKKIPLKEDHALEITKQVAAAFLSLNSLEIKNQFGQKVTVMHRDIKPANILFLDGVVKLADFGYAKMVDMATKNLKKDHTHLGSPLYTNPQTLAGENYSIKCDVWSFGCVLYESLVTKTPWTGKNINHLYSNITNMPIEFPRTMSEDCKDLLRKMLEIKEEKRLGWEGVAAHPALNRLKKKILIIERT